MAAEAYSASAAFAGTLSQATGIWAISGIHTAASGAHISNVYGVNAEIINNVSGTTIDTAIALHAVRSSNSGTITNYYDLYCATAGAQNYIAGDLRLGGVMDMGGGDILAGGTGTFSGALTSAAVFSTGAGTRPTLQHLSLIVQGGIGYIDCMDASGAWAPMQVRGSSITLVGDLDMNGNTLDLNGGAILGMGDITTAGDIYINAKQLRGGIGAETSGGVLDWNDVSNARSGNGNSLLRGSVIHGPGTNFYYHTFSFEAYSKDGSGNLTQFAIPYEDGNLLFRPRHSGVWQSYREIPSILDGVMSVNGDIDMNGGDILDAGTLVATAIATPNKIIAAAAVPASFADLAAVQAYLTSILN